MKKGCFITFEGPEGSGKSTHIALLAAYLRTRGKSVLVTREPGGTALATGIRNLLLEKEDPVSPLAELFLYEADRAQHVQEVIRPALKTGKIVLCDRYTDSTMAYQGDGRGLNRSMIETLNRLASDHLTPDLTLLLDVASRQGLQQAKAKKNRHDRLERAGLAFHQRVRRGFLRLAKQEPRRFRVITQQPTIEATQIQVCNTVNAFLHL